MAYALHRSSAGANAEPRHQTCGCVACPAFVVDNLETLEEMGMQGEETFLAAGGESFTLIPCALTMTISGLRA